MKALLRPHCALWLVTLVTGIAEAQQPVQPPNRLRVFLDCNSDDACDQREWRTEIQFVDWVLEPTAADVHIIITSQNAGGGAQHVFDLIGRNALSAVTDRLTLNAADTDTRREVLNRSTALLKAALARYLAHQGRATDIAIRAVESEEDERPVTAATRDPWNYWIFRIGVDGDIEGESRQSERRLSGNISANRTTLDWRLDFEIEGDFNRDRRELNDGQVFINDTDDWEISGLVVRSVAGRWSSGGQFSVSTSTRLNQRLAARSGAAIEYSFFPYEEANRRALLLHYQIGVARFNYDERTIFEKLEETVAEHRLSMGYDTQQTWGDASLSVHYSTFLRDWSKNRLVANADMGVRIFRGLELEIGGEYTRIRDQIYLSASDLSNEEIIAERRELATDYQYEARIGLSFRFGSVLNNFVNNRFPGSLLDFIN
jgi:hypothetical protein